MSLKRMKGDQGQNENKERQKERAREKHRVRDGGGATLSECESGVLTVTVALRLHDTWHVSSPAVSRSPATVLELRTPQLHTEIEMTMCGEERGLYKNQRPQHGAVCTRRDWKAAVLPRIYPYHWCKDDPKSITSQLYVAGPGLGLGTHSWTAVLNPQRGTNRKFENRIHTWVTLEGFGWINELSGSLSTCWGVQSFTSLC